VPRSFLPFFGTLVSRKKAKKPCEDKMASNRYDWSVRFPTGLETTNGTAIVMPSADGTAGQLLTTDGAGHWTFSDPSNNGANNTVFVTPVAGPLQYPNLTEALDAITTASSSNWFVVYVYPGTYTEPDTVQLKSHVSIRGLDQNACIIACSNPNVDLITAAPYSTISGLTLKDATGPTSALLSYHGGSILDDGYGFAMQNCLLGAASTLIRLRSDVGFCQVDLSQILVDPDANPTIVLDVEDAAIIEHDIALCIDGMNWFPPYPSSSNMISFLQASGTLTTIHISGSTWKIGGPSVTANGIHLENGVILTMSAGCVLSGFNYGLYIPNVSGVTPIIKLISVDLDDNAESLRILKLNATGYISACNFNRSNSTIVSPNSLAISSIHGEEGGMTLAGHIYQGESWASSTLMDDQFQRSSVLGLVTGGTMSAVGLLVSASVGEGYVSVGSFPTDYLKFVKWTSPISVTVPAMTLSYIAVDKDGALQYSAGAFDSDMYIILGGVYTSATDVLWFYRDAYVGARLANRLAVTLHDAFGALVQTGLTTSEAVGLPYELTVAAGSYFIGDDYFSPSGGTPVTFYEIYQNGLGGYTVVEPATSLVQDMWDSGTGSLVVVPAGQFAKHELFVLNDGSSETYLLLYGQELFATLGDAQTGSLPSNPNFLATLNICPIAAPIVEGGASNIIEIRDIRPQPQFRSTGTSGNSFHGALLGLANDDHLQYLLADGSRAMAGDLDMDTFAIVNSGLINGVTIENHHARHSRIGADPLDVAAPVTIGTANSIGAANTYSVSDHVHAHGSQTDTTLHALATTIAHGFMSSTDKTLINTATASATASSLVLRDGSAGGVFALVTASSDNGIKLNNAGNTFASTLKSGSGLAANLTVRLPASNGSSGQFMSTDGSGNTSWATPSATSSPDLLVTQSGALAVSWAAGTTSIEGTVASIAASSSAVSINIPNGIIYVGNDSAMHVTSGASFPSVSIPLATYVTNGTTITSLVDKRSFLGAAIGIASASQTGLVSATSQTFAGAKTFSSGLLSTTGLFSSTLGATVLSLTSAVGPLVLNSSATTTTIAVATGGSNRIYTMPDTGNTASTFVMTDSAQTINGTKTFSSAVPISATSNQLQLTALGTFRAILTTSASGFATANRTFTLVDPGTNANFVLDQGSVTMAGTYTFSNQISVTTTSNQLSLTAAGTRTAIITTSGSGFAVANRTLTLVDPGANANFVFDQGTVTMGGNYTFSNTVNGSSISLTGSAAPIVLNASGNTTTIAVATTGSNRIYTMPDTGNAASSFVMTDSAQTLNGIKTFTSGIPITATSNQLNLTAAGTFKAILTTSASLFATADRTLTLTDPGTNANFVYDQGTFTLAGNYSLSNTLNGTIVSLSSSAGPLILNSGGNRTTLAVATTGSNRIYTMPDTGGVASSFVMTDSAQTLNGIKTFTSGIPITATSNQLNLTATGTFKAILTTSASLFATADRTLTLTDPGTNANFVYDQGTFTMAGTYAFSNTMSGTIISLSSSAGPIVMNSGGNRTTVAVATTGSNRIYTMPDTGGVASSFVMTDSAQTLNGIKTFTSGIPITATSNQLNLTATGTFKAILTTSALLFATADRTLTLTDPGTNANFVYDQGTFTLAGTYTTSNALLAQGGISTSSGALSLNSATGAINTNNCTVGTISTLTATTINNATALNGKLLTINSTANLIVYQTLSTTTDVANRIEISAQGMMRWGDGTAAVDTRFYRTAASTMTLDNNSSGGGTLVVNTLATNSVTTVSGTDIAFNSKNFTGVGTLNTRTIANFVDNAGASTDLAIAKFSGTTGKTVQNSGILIDASNNVTGMGTLNTRTIANLVDNAGASTNLAIAKFSGTGGKTVQNSGVIIDASNNVSGMGTLNTRTIANWIDGPASSTSNAVVKYSGTGGKTALDSGVIIDASNNITGVVALTTTGTITTPTLTSTSTLTITPAAASKISVDLTSGKKMKLYGTDASPAVLLQFGEAGTVDTFPMFEIGSNGGQTWGSNAAAWDVGFSRSAAKTMGVFNASFATTDTILNVGTVQVVGISTQSGTDITFNSKNLISVGTLNSRTIANLVENASTSTDTAIAKFSGAGGKTIQNSGVLIDASNNITGAGTLNTRTIANWVDGPASATSTAIPTFNGTGGKTIQNSVLLLDTLGRLTGAITLNSSATITNVGTRCMVIACEVSGTTAQIVQSTVKNSVLLASIDSVFTNTGGATSYTTNLMAATQACVFTASSTGNILSSVMMANAAGGAIQTTGTSTINSCCAIGYNNTVTTVSAGGILALNVMGGDNAVNATGAINYCTLIGRTHTLNAGTQICLIGSNHSTSGVQTASTAIGSYISVNSGGALGLGDNSTTTPLTLGANALSARYAGGYFFFTNSALTTGVAAGPGATAWTSLSDERLKKDIVPLIGKGLYDEVKSLKVFNYRLKKDDTERLRIGVSANQVHEKFANKYLHPQIGGYNDEVVYADLITELKKEGKFASHEKGFHRVSAEEIGYLHLAAFQDAQKIIDSHTETIAKQKVLLEKNASEIALMRQQLDAILASQVSAINK
jgi:hypothetical protein